MERKINDLSGRSTFLWSPPPYLSGRYPLMYRWSPRTGRLIFFFFPKPLCWLVWRVLWRCHWLMGREGDSRLLLIPLFKYFPLFMAVSPAKEMENSLSSSWIPLNNENFRIVDVTLCASACVTICTNWKYVKPKKWGKIIKRAQSVINRSLASKICQSTVMHPS